MKTGRNFEDAKSICQIRGYICRLSKPESKFYRNLPKNHIEYFGNLHNYLPQEDVLAQDWAIGDPDEDEGLSMTGF